MKKWILLLAAPLLIVGCSSIAVFSAFDSAVDFNQYSTYAYLKKDIDAVSISDFQDDFRVNARFSNSLI